MRLGDAQRAVHRVLGSCVPGRVLAVLAFAWRWHLGMCGSPAVRDRAHGRPGWSAPMGLAVRRRRADHWSMLKPAASRVWDLGAGQAEAPTCPARETLGAESLLCFPAKDTPRAVTAHRWGTKAHPVGHDGEKEGLFECERVSTCRSCFEGGEKGPGSVAASGSWPPEACRGPCRVPPLSID